MSITVNTNNVLKKQQNIWNHILFHPTDAIEDEWGKKILDEISKDKAAEVVRIYSMMEDIVSMDERGTLKYDFTLNDIRLDYLLEKGFTPMIAYAGIPACIAKSTEEKSSVSYGKTRYKGKMWITSPPKDYKLWEDICYEYTKHIVERYGEETVAKWYIHCFNEPDIDPFFMKNSSVKEKCTEYCKLYTGFEKGVLKVSHKLKIGGPAIAGEFEFLEGFLKFISETGKKIDYICFHNYGINVEGLIDGTDDFTVKNHFKKYDKVRELVLKYIPQGIEIIQDEWGACTGGFVQIDRCPKLIFRETEKFSRYYGKMITEFVKNYDDAGKIVICLSGQHEMNFEFEGFRNFFSLNFIKKPIYNAYILTGKLHNQILEDTTDNKYLHILPTKNKDGKISVLFTYSSDNFSEDLESLNETVTFQGIEGKKTVRLWKIDKENTNPYREFQKNGWAEKLTSEQIYNLQKVTEIKPQSYLTDAKGSLNIDINMTANGLMLVEIE